MKGRVPVSRRALIGCGALALVLLALSWRATRHAAPIGVLIITLDTTRADRLSPYGFMNVSLPAIERLAREGVMFDQATSAAPLTLPAHTTLFTGLLPPQHGVRDNADAPLAESKTTLAEVLSAAGFRTAAFVGSVVLAPDRGLKQGFEEYRGVAVTDGRSPEARQRRADAVVDDAIAWLDTLDESRFFLWTHLYDPHRPYDPPEPFQSQYAHDPYIGEIAFADAQVGRLLQALENRRLLERTLVILTADHGESLGEHGERDHGIFIYESVLRVPLVMRAPALPPARIGDVVRLTDIMATALEMLAVPSPPTNGTSLVGLMRGRERALDLEAYSESRYPERLGWSSLRALRDSRFKLIDAPRPELYDLMQDPFEERNIYADRRTVADAMTARIAAIADGAGDRREPLTTVTPEVRDRLAALGYVASGPPERSSTGPLPDPKDCIGTFTSGAMTGRPYCLRFDPTGVRSP